MPRSLSHRGLQAFRLTVLTGSVSAAAASVARSQPAVSRLLSELEGEIGFRLFDRVKGRLIPTAEGMLLFDEVQRSFVGLDRIASAAADIRKGRKGTLSIASMPALSSSVLPKVIARLAIAQPETAILFQEMPSSMVAQLILARECHLGLVSMISVISPMELERHYRAVAMCIMSKGHRLATRKTVKVTDLEGEPFIAISTSTGFGAQLANVLERAVADRQTRVETHLCHLASALVLQGAGIAVVDSITAVGHVQAGGLARPFAADIAMEFGIIRLGGSESSDMQKRFIAACDATLAAVPGVTSVATAGLSPNTRSL